MFERSEASHLVIGFIETHYAEEWSRLQTATIASKGLLRDAALDRYRYHQQVSAALDATETTLRQGLKEPQAALAAIDKSQRFIDSSIRKQEAADISTTKTRICVTDLLSKIAFDPYLRNLLRTHLGDCGEAGMTIDDRIDQEIEQGLHGEWHLLCNALDAANARAVPLFPTQKGLAPLKGVHAEAEERRRELTSRLTETSPDPKTPSRG